MPPEIKIHIIGTVIYFIALAIWGINHEKQEKDEESKRNQQRGKGSGSV